MNSQESNYHKLSLNYFLPNKGKMSLLRPFSPILDRILGLRKLKQFYNKHQLAGASFGEFTDRYLKGLELQVTQNIDSASLIPSQGPLVVVANHPLGGPEGILLADLIFQQRKDLHVLANRALSVFTELDPHFIFTNPFVTNAKGNLQSLRSCHKVLKDEGVLLLFPAGKVSASESEGEPVVDSNWNPLIAKLQRKYDTSILSIHIEASNSKWFYKLGHVNPQLRAGLLVREMLNSYRKPVRLSLGKAMNIQKYISDDQQLTDFYRLRTYLLGEVERAQWPSSELNPQMEELAEPQDPQVLIEELKSLPEHQCLVKYKSLSTYWLRGVQAPSVVQEIRRLREKCFRLMDEGSGKPMDGDELDFNYLHLLIFDQDTQQIVGAYRMGPTDELKEQGIPVYLSAMFKFSGDFVNQRTPCLEMGRSFIIPEYQKSFHGLLMLFKGISTYVAQHAHYETLYGTVSLSKQFSPLSVYLIQRVLSNGDPSVEAVKAFDYGLIQELEDYLTKYEMNIDVLDELIKGLEPDGKGLPVLVRQYHALGAQFHCLGIDPNFAETPGLLLSVHVPSAPERLLKLYMGTAKDEYLKNFQKVV